MKKMLTLALATMAFAAVADEISCGSVGFITISNDLTNNIVAVPFKELGKDSNICASNLVKTTNLTIGDEMFVLSGSEYQVWELAEQNDVKYWNQIATKSTMNSKDLTAPAEETLLATGTALWIRRKDVSKPIYLYGQAVSGSGSLTTSLTAGVMNLVANPLYASTTLNAKLSPENGDKIAVISNGIPLQYTWMTYNSQTKWWGMNPSTYEMMSAEDITIVAGQGLWIKPKNSKIVTWQ